MAFRILSTDAQFNTNVALPILRPALMVHLDLTAGSVYATTHIRSVTVGGETWTSVGAFGFVEVSESTLEGSATRARVGLVGLPMETLTPTSEAALIGRPAHIYRAAFDANWDNPGIEVWFSGYIDGADTKIEPQENGDTLVSYFLTISDRSSPRRRLSNNHAIGNGAAGDTAQALMFTIKEIQQWPQN